MSEEDWKLDLTPRSHRKLLTSALWRRVAVSGEFTALLTLSLSPSVGPFGILWLMVLQLTGIRRSEECFRYYVKQ